MNANPWLRALLILLVAIAALYLGGMLWQLGARFADVFLLFFVAWLIAFILNPVVRLVLRRLAMPRALAVGLVYLGVMVGLVAVGFLVLPPTFYQLNLLGQSLPDYVQGLPDVLPQGQAWLDQRGIEVDLKAIYRGQELVQRAETWGTTIAQNALNLAQGIASAIMAGILTLVLSFYIMLDGERITQVFLDILPGRYRYGARYVMDNIDRSFGGYLRGNLILAVTYGVGTALVMWWQGLSFVFPVSAFAGFMLFIPFLGTILAILPPMVIVLFTGSLAKIILVLITLLVLQQIVLQIIAPKLIGQSVGLHPLLVILALLLGAQVAGIWGLLFGVPVMAVLYSLAVAIYQRLRAHEPVLPL